MAELDEGHMPHGERRYFGPRLFELRETFAARTARPADASAILLRARPTARALVECLQGQGYSISAPTLSEIESGAILPRDGEAFLTAIGKCLQINEDDMRDLTKRLAFDILYARLGDAAAQVIPPQRDWR